MHIRTFHCALYSSPRQRTVRSLLYVSNPSCSPSSINMAEAEYVSCTRRPPVLAKIPARVQALDGRNRKVNSLPRAPKGEQV